MSEFQRLKRVVNSWIGGARHHKKRRLATYQADDALLILNGLGWKMSPKALEYLAGNSLRREDFLMQIYAAEDSLGVDLIRDNVMLNPDVDPKVYEVEGKIGITAMVKGEEYLIAEFPW
ncbi:MAG: hypothetical protein RLZZ165_41 [Bacteroidota bacterium]|jgi:hypothetical protein